MVQLIIGLVVAAASLFAVHTAWSGFKDSIGTPYAQAQMAKDQAAIDAAEGRATAAEAKSGRAEAENNSCQAKAKNQSDAVDAAEKRAKAAQADANELRRKQRLEEAASAPRIADLQARAGAAPKLMACKEELDKAKLIMVNSLRAKRGLPPLAEVPANAPPLPALVK